LAPAKFQRCATFFWLPIQLEIYVNSLHHFTKLYINKKQLEQISSNKRSTSGSLEWEEMDLGLWLSLEHYNRTREVFWQAKKQQSQRPQ
jgi:hypothetical protein